MWSVYGNQGVAVKTTAGKVAKVVEAKGYKFIYGPMTYVDHRTGTSAEFNPEQKSDFPLLLRPFFLKREEYKSEQEVRFIIAAAERERGGILLLQRESPRLDFGNPTLAKTQACGGAIALRNDKKVFAKSGLFWL